MRPPRPPPPLLLLPPPPEEPRLLPPELPPLLRLLPPLLERILLPPSLERLGRLWIEPPSLLLDLLGRSYVRSCERREGRLSSFREGAASLRRGVLFSLLSLLRRVGVSERCGRVVGVSERCGRVVGVSERCGRVAGVSSKRLGLVPSSLRGVRDSKSRPEGVVVLGVRVRPEGSALVPSKRRPPLFGETVLRSVAILPFPIAVPGSISLAVRPGRLVLFSITGTLV